MESRLYKFGTIIESILFVAGDPIKVTELSKALNISVVEVESSIEYLKDYYEKNDRGIRLKVFNDNVQLTTSDNYSVYINRVLQPIQKQNITDKTMETLAIIAYKQPITKNEIEQIRGVKCDYSIQSLLAKDLVKIVGKKDTVGNPSLYSTTDKFLSHFGISSLSELPPIIPFEELETYENIE